MFVKKIEDRFESNIARCMKCFVADFLILLTLFSKLYFKWETGK